MGQTESADSDEEEESDYANRLHEEELIRRMEEGQNVCEERGEESVDFQNMLKGVRCAAHTLQLALLFSLIFRGSSVN